MKKTCVSVAWGGVLAALCALVATAAPAAAAEAAPSLQNPVVLFGAVPLDFVLFAVTLLGVALFHHRTFTAAGLGLAAIVVYQFVFTGFREGAGIGGMVGHVEHEWVVLGNLFLLLMGFGLLSRHFEESKAPDAMPRLLPDDWKGGLALLGLVFVLSSFLDNIAAALIGGVVARHVYHGKVSIGYLAAIVAASNAGGSGSVVGDTTTTMMWIAGHSPLDVVHAYVGAVVCFVVLAPIAAVAQQKYSPIQRHRETGFEIDWGRVGVVGFILVCAVGANVAANIYFPAMLDMLPVIGIGVWVAILVSAPFRTPDWAILKPSLKTTVFLLFLVTAASLMPVERLPEASWQTAFGLGFISSVFDNIPLTALALSQGGYDWGVLAYAVGFGGSMIWFGSSAGVALSTQYPEARSVGTWIKQGWYVIVGYVVGFFALLLVMGFNPLEQ